MKRHSATLSTLGVFVILAAAAPWLVGDGGVALLFEVLLMLTMAQLWNLLAGYTGLVSMGLQCFVGLGGYTTIFAANTFSVSPYWVLPLAPLVCGLIGAVSAPFLFRLRDAYFSISTWVFAEVVAMLVFITPGLGHVTGMTLETAREIDYRDLSARELLDRGGARRRGRDGHLRASAITAGPRLAQCAR